MHFGRIIVLFVIVACAGCELAENYTDPSGPRYAGQYAADPSERARLPLVQSVTFNIQFGRAIDVAIEELTTRSDLAGADVILLQEMDAAGTDAIAAALGRDYVYYPGSIQHGRDFGNAVLSRWPLVDDEKIILPHRSPTDGRIRIAVRATIRTPLGDAEVYSVHTETPWLGPRARLEQAETVLVHSRSRKAHTIVAGDFNTSDPGSLEELVRRYAAERFVWASRDSGATAGPFTLDSTFVREFEPLASGSVPSLASDHQPQWVHVEFLPGR